MSWIRLNAYCHVEAFDICHSSADASKERPAAVISNKSTTIAIATAITIPMKNLTLAVSFCEGLRA